NPPVPGSTNRAWLFAKFVTLQKIVAGCSNKVSPSPLALELVNRTPAMPRLPLVCDTSAVAPLQLLEYIRTVVVLVVVSTAMMDAPLALWFKAKKLESRITNAVLVLEVNPTIKARETPLPVVLTTTLQSMRLATVLCVCPLPVTMMPFRLEDPVVLAAVLSIVILTWDRVLVAGSSMETPWSVVWTADVIRIVTCSRRVLAFMVTT